MKLNKEQIDLFLLTLVADTNNFLMEQDFKGDATIAASDIMKRCHFAYNLFTEEKEEEVEEEK